MTEPLDSVVVIIIAQRCKSSATNLMTDEELRALVNTEILSYNEDTPEPTSSEDYGPVETENIEECADAVVTLLKGYVRGTLPMRLENTVGWTYDPNEEIEGESPAPTPAPSY